MININGYRYENGRPLHDDDCWYKAVNVCTCGLLHKANHEGHRRVEWVRHETDKQYAAYKRIVELIPVIEGEPCLINQTDKTDTPT